MKKFSAVLALFAGFLAAPFSAQADDFTGCWDVSLSNATVIDGFRTGTIAYFGDVIFDLTTAKGGGTPGGLPSVPVLYGGSATYSVFGMTILSHGAAGLNENPDGTITIWFKGDTTRWLSAALGASENMLSANVILKKQGTDNVYRGFLSGRMVDNSSGASKVTTLINATVFMIQCGRAKG